MSQQPEHMINTIVKKKKKKKGYGDLIKNFLCVEATCYGSISESDK